MAEFKLDRFKYRWQGDWVAGTEYRRDDIVRLNGKSYVCLVGHTADADFEVDLNYIVPGSNPPLPEPKWTEMTSGKTFVGDWQSSTVYYLGDIVLYDGNLYVCNNIHTSTLFEDNKVNWSTFIDHIKFVGNWSSSTSYGRGAVVKYGGKAYKCVNAHLSSTSLEDNQSDWQLFFDGIEYRGEWQSATLYRENDLVRYGGTIFKCFLTHTSGAVFSDNNFVPDLIGYQFNGEWNNSTYYQVGDIVSYSGTLWYCLNNNIAVDPYEQEIDSAGFWIQLLVSYKFQGDWSVNNAYKPGDVVNRGGNLYIANVEIDGFGQVGIPGTPENTIGIISEDEWTLLTVGQDYKAQWSEDTVYSLNDVVIFQGTTYICPVEHESSLQNFPGDNGNGIDYWDILSERGTDVGMSTKGDLLSFGLNRTVQGDGSSQGYVGIPIGNTDQILSIADDDQLFWKTYLNDSDVIYVSQSGDNYTGDGSIFKPFA